MALASGCEDMIAMALHEGFLDRLSIELLEARPQILDGDVMCACQCDECWPLVHIVLGCKLFPFEG